MKMDLYVIGDEMSKEITETKGWSLTDCFLIPGFVAF